MSQYKFFFVVVIIKCDDLIPANSGVDTQFVYFITLGHDIFAMTK